jgi:tryptophanyl-tRNA synthetase
MEKKIVLTGDRPTGPLHLGHYVGSLQNRLLLQEQYHQYIMIADIQALTDNYDQPEILEENIFHILACYLAVGLDPQKNTFFLQSKIPELSELTIYFMNLVSLNRLQRNPTIKEEIKQKGYDESVQVGFLCYPISQAADILLFKSNLIPVGNDQLPMIEQANEIGRTFNHIYKKEFFPHIEALLSNTGRLIGIDGKSKMSKSLKNALFLNDSKEVLFENIMKMYTDPLHIKVSDPGRIEGNVVFAYLDVFDKNKEELEILKTHYQKGGLGDVSLKRRLHRILEETLLPIREQYHFFINQKTVLKEILQDHTKKIHAVAKKNISEIKEIMKINYF